MGEAVLKVGWFSTGRGEGSLGLLRTVMDAIGSGELQAQMEFVFSNREPGEAEGSDRFVRQVLDYGIPLVTLSSQRFRREQSGGPFSRHRKQFDREGYAPPGAVPTGRVRAGRLHANHGR